MMNESVKRFWCLLLVVLAGFSGWSQKIYFVDGFHGGIYGHYPPQYTAFITEQLARHPDWSVCLELEPETWDSVQRNEPANYAAFRELLADQSDRSRIEYVNPTYGQSYLYNINGESIIRQFSYGIRKMKQHFPGLVYDTYSSEEPCFTSSLPQVLLSFGYKYASLKNPNTCWGGYTRAFGGELVNWKGPDGSSILTVPRYASEELDPNSTWQTTASTNSKAYISSALAAGIANPVGMCLQDAGWKFGPWLRTQRGSDKSSYTTWRNYFANVEHKAKPADWHLSQEDVQVSLVWGSQVLQQIAGQVRVAENRIVRAEKLASLASVIDGVAYPHATFDEGWRGILLAQHHDCWIVPYNGKRNNTWIDKVRKWTADADSLSSSADDMSWQALDAGVGNESPSIRIYNSNGTDFSGVVSLQLPAAFNGNGTAAAAGRDSFSLSDGTGAAARLDSFSLSDATGAAVVYQLDGNELSFLAQAPATGISTYILTPLARDSVQQHRPVAGMNSNPQRKPAAFIPGTKSSMITKQSNGDVVVETDLYRLRFDPARGGAMVSLVGKKMNNKEFVNNTGAAGINVMKGSFFRDNADLSTSDYPAKISTVVDGPLLATIRIEGAIGKHPFTQTVTVTRAGELIDVDLLIDWIGNPGIGDSYKQAGGYKGEDYRKAFYDDSKKLLTVFPLNLAGQKVFRNAPFDVTESALSNTFFRTWDSIKNNIILNWVDVTDAGRRYGLALFTDRTTSYAHDEAGTLGLTTQYSGVGLWGMNYRITGPTTFRYAIYPHAGDWEKAGVWQKNVSWNNPVEVRLAKDFKASGVPAVPGAGTAKAHKKISVPRLLSLANQQLELTSVVMDGDDLLVRLFNAGTRTITTGLRLHVIASAVTGVELDGRIRKVYKLSRSKEGVSVKIAVPAFGIQTFRISGIKKDLL